MVDRTAIDYGKQWGMFFGSGIVAWFIAISFAKFLPPSLQILFLSLPVAFFCYSLFILPQWQQQGRQRDVEARLTEVERSTQLMHQHHVTMASQELDFAYTMDSLQDLYPERVGYNPSPVESESPPMSPHTLQQNVIQAAGEVGWEFVQYLTSKFDSLVDADGFIKLARVRSSWARNRNLDTDSLRRLIQAFVNLGLTEWKDGKQQEFKPLLVTMGD